MTSSPAPKVDDQEASSTEAHQNRRQAALRRLRRQRQIALTRARKRMHR